MAMTAQWFQFSPENGGVVRINVIETVGVGQSKRILPGRDIDRPLSSFSDDVQTLILDVFATLADEENSAPKAVEAIIAAEVGP